MVVTYHVVFASLVHKLGEGERDDGAGGQGEVGVDERALLLVPVRRAAVKARPEDPQEHRAWGGRGRWGECTSITYGETVLLK